MDCGLQVVEKDQYDYTLKSERSSTGACRGKVWGDWRRWRSHPRNAEKPIRAIHASRGFSAAALVQKQAAFWAFKLMQIAFECARRNLQSAIYNLQLH
jgi:hypothetical protein